jgi:predicted enzyme related to lactoylglutathione lyase
VNPYGSFCFADLNTRNAAGAAQFYGAILGWRVADAPEARGTYSLFQSDGKTVAGLRHAHPIPAGWVCYLAVESADATAARARELGASVLAPPADVPGLARTCVLQDPEGAQFGLWEARGSRGADAQDTHASMWWVELLARDVVAARKFYTSLFPWSVRETLTYGPASYTVFTIGEMSVAGAAQFGPDWDVTPRWQVYFSVPDYEAVAARAATLGGTIDFQRDVPAAGRLGIMRDPERALFAVMRPNWLTDVAEDLIRTVEGASDQLRTLGEPLVSAKRGPDAWSIKEILGHLIDSAANNHHRFVRAQYVEDLAFPGYDQDEWVRLQDYRGASWTDLIEFWRLYNRRLAYVIRRIADTRLDALCRIGSGDPVTLRYLIEDYLVHLRHHLQQIEERRTP